MGYLHDMHGALIGGYVNRTRAAVHSALDEAAGWSRPYHSNTATAYSRVGLVLGELLKQARRLGMTEDDITRMLTRERATGEFGCRGKARDRALSRDEQVHDEDPTRGSMDWTEYDAYVDDLPPASLRSALKAEARLRAAAQAQIK